MLSSSLIGNVGAKYKAKCSFKVSSLLNKQVHPRQNKLHCHFLTWNGNPPSSLDNKPVYVLWRNSVPEWKCNSDEVSLYRQSDLDLAGEPLQALLTLKPCMEYEGIQSTNESARAMTSFCTNLLVTVTVTLVCGTQTCTRRNKMAKTMTSFRALVI